MPGADHSGIDHAVTSYRSNRSNPTDYDLAKRRLLLAVRGLAIGLYAVMALSGQAVLHDAKKIADAQKLFDTLRGGEAPCEVLTIRPHFIFSGRLQSGYVLHAPMTRSVGQGEKWIVLTSIMSKERNGRPVYLSDVVQFPPASDGGESKAAGIFWLGKGRYSVQFLMFDDRGDVCRKRWEVDARLNFSAGKPNPILAPGTVSDSALNDLADPLGAKPIAHLTILLHAASLLQRQSALLDMDKAMLPDAVVALMEELPARSVRLVVFNLEQQNEVFRRDNVTLDVLPAVSQTLDGVQASTVDYRVLQNPAGTLNLIRNLVNREVHASDPSELVIFLGPRSIYKDKHFADSGLPPGPKRQFFYIVWERPPMPGGAPEVGSQQAESGPTGMRAPPFAGMEGRNPYDWPTMINYGPNHGPDSIEYAVDHLEGKTFRVDSAESFAKAVAEIARRAGIKR